MDGMLRGVSVCLFTLFIVSCATTQSRYVPLGKTYSSKAEGAIVEVFHTGLPEKAFVRIARLDVHLEKTGFIRPNFNEALPELKKQARLSGADAIIEIQERSSMRDETGIYHITAIGIKYTD
jgi:hypothetical protein